MFQRQTVRTAVLGMVSLLLPVSVQSQQLVQIDLTKDKVDTVKVGVGNFTVRLSNALPGRKYEVRAEVVGTKEPALVDLRKVRVDTIRITQRDTVFAPNVQPPPPPACAIRDTMSVYLPIRAELDIAGTMEAVRRAMALDTAKNRECTLEVRRGAQLVVTRGTYQGVATGGIRVSAGQTVAATVYRDEIAVGAIVLESTASPRGGFLSYGVHYPMGSRVRRYAVGSADADGERPVKAAGTDGADPAVLLAVSIPTPTSWLYASGFLPTGFSDGAVVGWGGGGTIAISDQFLMHFGGVVGTQRRLRPTYRDATATVTSELTEDQLTEAKFSPRFTIGVTLRLGSNPFAKATQ